MASGGEYWKEDRMKTFSDCAWRRLSAVGLAMAVWCGLVSGLDAQMGTVEFWEAYTAAMNDPAGFGKKRDLVKKNQVLIPQHVNYQIHSISNTLSLDEPNMDDVKNRIKILEDIARVYQLNFRKKVLDLRVAYAKSLTKETAKLHSEAQTKWNTFVTRNAQEAKSEKMIKEMIALGEEVAKLFEQTKEDFICAEVYQLIGDYYMKAKNYADATVWYQKSKKAFARHRRKAKENYVAYQLFQLEKKHGVGKAEDKDGNPVKPTEKKKKPEPKAFPAVTLKFKKGKKGPDEFASPMFWGVGGDHMLWKDVTLKKGVEKTWPLGVDSKIVWEGGSKIFVEIGGKKKRIKSGAGKPLAVDLPVDYGDAKGKYRVRLKTLGEERFLSATVNYATSDTLYLKMTRECSMTGTFNGVKFHLIDDNLNGKYNDFGDDLIQFGKEPVQPLSPVINVGGKLFGVKEVSAPGDKVVFTEFNGETGTLQATWKGASGVKPAVLFYKCTQGNYKDAIFNVADGKPMVVPYGYYQLFRGQLRKGKGKKILFATILTGKNEVFLVDENKTTVQKLGAPYDVHAVLEKDGDNVVVTGQGMTVYGAALEQYGFFYPDAYKPVISLRVKGGRTIAKGKKMTQADETETRKSTENAWHPKPFKVKGSGSATYEFRANMTSKLLGKVKGKWNEAPFKSTP